MLLGLTNVLASVGDSISLQFTRFDEIGYNIANSVTYRCCKCSNKNEASDFVDNAALERFSEMEIDNIDMGDFAPNIRDNTILKETGLSHFDLDGDDGIYDIEKTIDIDIDINKINESIKENALDKEEEKAMNSIMYFVEKLLTGNPIDENEFEDFVLTISSKDALNFLERYGETRGTEDLDLLEDLMSQKLELILKDEKYAKMYAGVLDKIDKMNNEYMSEKITFDEALKGNPTEGLLKPVVKPSEETMNHLMEKINK